MPIISKWGQSKGKNILQASKIKKTKQNKQTKNQEILQNINMDEEHRGINFTSGLGNAIQSELAPGKWTICLYKAGLRERFLASSSKISCGHI